MRVFVVLGIDAEFFGQIHERALRGIAQNIARIVGILFRVDAKSRARQKVLIHRAVVFFGKFLRFCSYALQKVVADGKVRYRHFIERERARFIATDDGGTAQRFDGGQAFDERVLFGHALHAESHDDGRRCGQPLRNDGNRQRNRYENIIDPRRPAVADEPDGEDDDTDDEPDQTQRFAHGIELALHGGIRFVLFVEEVCDLADLGIHARTDDDARRVAVHDDGRTVCHVDAVA